MNLNFAPNKPTGIKIDKETGLQLCEYHGDRIKHFFCMTHKVSCCRNCVEILHSEIEC